MNLAAASLTGDTTEKKGARQHERKLVHERMLFLVGRKAKGFSSVFGWETRQEHPFGIVARRRTIKKQNGTERKRQHNGNQQVFRKTFEVSCRANGCCVLCALVFPNRAGGFVSPSTPSRLQRETRGVMITPFLLVFSNLRGAMVGHHRKPSASLQSLLWHRPGVNTSCNRDALVHFQCRHRAASSTCQ